MTISLSFDEKDIEDFLCEGDNLELYLNLRFVARQVEIFGFRIDILGYNRLDKCFYIIELKKDELNSKAFAQAFKYFRLMNIKYNIKTGEKHRFKILLVGQNLNSELVGVTANYIQCSESNATYLYTLFSYDFADGICFNYRNKEEKIFDNNLQEYLNE